MACGTPVVATNIWGTPEVVAAPEAGLLVQERTPAAIAAALRRLLSPPPLLPPPPSFLGGLLTGLRQTPPAIRHCGSTTFPCPDPFFPVPLPQPLASKSQATIG